MLGCDIFPTFPPPHPLDFGNAEASPLLPRKNTYLLEADFPQSITSLDPTAALDDPGFSRLFSVTVLPRNAHAECITVSYGPQASHFL